MYSGIIDRLCAYCAYSTGIDTTSQKMLDDEVRNFDMWLVVEEVMVHQLVMAWVMVFSVVVSEVGASGGPVNIEVALASVIPDPVEAHVNRL